MRHTPVLIVGAGPTGLVLAAQLQRFGITFRLIDKHHDVLELTKAAALHARTLEHFRDLGIVDRILHEGQRVDILRLRTGYRDRIGIDFRELTDVAYPFMIDIPQASTERILIEHLTARGVPVERDVTCTAIEQTADGVLATVTLPDGTRETLSTDWLVGCDGAHSTVRSAIGVDFPGDAYPDDWVLCDAELEWPLPRNEMTFCGDRQGICGVFPLPGAHRYRLAYTQNHTASGELVEPDLADAQYALSRTGIEGRIRSVDQFWTFDLSHRHAARYRYGRVFLAGDAGHVHTPFGGQGLNLGVADAIDVGWKLAAVLTGRAPAALLDTYPTERHGVATEVVRFTHLGAQAMLLRDDPRRHLRDGLLTALQASPAVRRRIGVRLSQLGHSYRTPRRPWTRDSLRSGDRIPDPELFDGLADRRVRLHDLLSSAGFTAVVTGHESDSAWRPALGVVDTLRRRHGVAGLILTTGWNIARDAVAHRAPTVLDRGRDARALYGRHPRLYLVRPDRHIGFAGPPDSADLEGYLTDMFTDAPIGAR
ncbi:FAD-dependent monooxygenase [Nocardia sp. CNY236]|uniref:FAD-dependent monooxygenase n=1 Tax=Nocardia sp. CNY236 TaxID=1169152 RepID=UPI00041E8441|nr:FAD-dependent monooxygenase [Nocardia sp. CNY236]